MPVVTVDWWKGNDRKKRADLVNELTSTLARIAECPREAVTVLVRDVEQDHWGRGGVLADEPAAAGADRAPDAEQAGSALPEQV
ncbi:4-oxalocrotonate tautomerase family enzyme [Streptomyces sp. DH-12]|uniref:tautomerase family protein n=1 Tax=unclassified Streptomyces TaxID=2593676 RepID=UPI000CCE839E|nr:MULTISPECIES: 4-oxalocrotonate tautomerase family protein [unclassified Streptomyces]MDN3268906.1 4-oxalocrotonate tautomerase family protein [Streptomyces sp. MA15]PNV31854.1 4-oxalocrotonate tautomerase family enzyme [Streptomyces sp. DH-12]